MSIDIDVCFCLNVLIKSQETFVFSKTILQVFSFKEVFTKGISNDLEINYGYCPSSFLLYHSEELFIYTT